MQDLVSEFSKIFRGWYNITQLWAVRVWKCSKLSECWNKFLV